eukprot:3157149-Rhodomonas_salina.1
MTAYQVSALPHILYRLGTPPTYSGCPSATLPTYSRYPAHMFYEVPPLGKLGTPLTARSCSYTHTLTAAEQNPSFDPVEKQICDALASISRRSSTLSDMLQKLEEEKAAEEVWSAICLRAPYVMSGTDIAHAAVRPRFPYAMSGTELPYAATRTKSGALKTGPKSST